MQIDSLDHLVLTVRDVAATSEFYHTVLGMDVVLFADDRTALVFGQQKINLHQSDQEFEPKADRPTPGSADLCFITSMPLSSVMAHLAQCGIAVLTGPVTRTGARGAMQSLHIRDPDQKPDRNRQLSCRSQRKPACCCVELPRMKVYTPETAEGSLWRRG